MDISAQRHSTTSAQHDVRAGRGWRLHPVSRIEDLSDAVLGAGLSALQMSSGRFTGSLAFLEHNGITYTSGQIGGRVALSGPLSDHLVTFGLGLSVAAGTRHWLEEVHEGSIGVFLPGDEHEALYASGSLYVAASLSLERLEAEAAQEDLVLDRRTLGGTRFHPRRVSTKHVAPLRHHLESMHAGNGRTSNDLSMTQRMLRLAISHFARAPRAIATHRTRHIAARTVRRAQDYVAAHLDRPLAVDEIAAAAHTSRRTLYRAFAEILGETPGSYIRKLRLHQIRRDISDSKAESVAMIGQRWGIHEPGRLAGWYRQHFDELPSQTRDRARHPLHTGR